MKDCIVPMRSFLKSTLETLWAGSGLAARAHRRREPSAATILMYHGVVAKPLPVPDWCFILQTDFRDQMLELRRRFEILPLHTLADRLKAGEITRPAAAITFDDGYLNNFEVAFPILTDLQLPATVFLNTDFIGTDQTVWFGRLHRAITLTTRRSLEWEGALHPLKTREEQARASAILQARLKALDHDEMLEVVDDLSERLGVNPREPIPRDEPYRMLDLPAIGTMAQSGLIEFGAHTASHTILTRVDTNRTRREIEQSVRATSELSGRPCRSFAYPNGRHEDYDTTAIEILKDAGVDTAVTTIEGPNRPETPRMELRRTGVGAGESLNNFRMRIHHQYAK